MNYCRQAKADLKKEALALHWTLYITGATNVRPAHDLNLAEMPQRYLDAIELFHRQAWLASA